MQIIKTILLYSLTLAIGLGIGIGAQYGYRWYSQAPVMIETDTRAHFAETDTAIVLYTTSWCPYCKKARAFLDSHNIAYTDRDIESGQPAITNLYQSIGYEGVPKIVLNNKIINGFNQPLLVEELKNLNLM